MRQWIETYMFWALIGVGIALVSELSEKQLIVIGLALLMGIYWRLSQVRDDLRGAAEKLGYKRHSARRIDKLLKKQFDNNLTKAEEEKLKELVDADETYSVARSGQLIHVIQELRKLTRLVGPSERRKKTMHDQNGTPKFVHEAEVPIALQKGWTLPPFSVVLTNGGTNTLNVIKAVREVTNLDLEAARELVYGAPNPIAEVFTEEEAAKIRKKLEAAGGKVEVE